MAYNRGARRDGGSRRPVLESEDWPSLRPPVDVGGGFAVTLAYKKGQPGSVSHRLVSVEANQYVSRNPLTADEGTDLIAVLEAALVVAKADAGLIAEHATKVASSREEAVAATDGLTVAEYKATLAPEERERLENQQLRSLTGSDA